MRQSLEVARVEDPDVGGNLIAGVDEHDIAEAELLGVKGDLLSVPWKERNAVKDRIFNRFTS
jgi:hypothetical protein